MFLPRMRQLARSAIATACSGSLQGTAEDVHGQHLLEIYLKEPLVCCNSSVCTQMAS